MPLDTRPSHSLTFAEACEIVSGSSRDLASPADAALLLVAAPEQVKTGLRPVTHEDPAHFACGRLLPNGTANNDYGKVFPRRSANPALTTYTFDREGYSFARLCPAPEGKWLEVCGRLFEIEGASQ